MTDAIETIADLIIQEAQATNGDLVEAIYRVQGKVLTALAEKRSEIRRADILKKEILGE